MENNDVKKSGIDELGKIIGVVTAVTFCLSVIFDWGYFEALGLSFTDVPTTIADHVRDALLWVPGILSAALGFTLLELMTRRIEGGLTDGELANISRNPQRTAWIRRSPYKAFVALSITTIFFNYFFGDAFAKGMSVAVPVIMLEIIRWSFSHKKVADSISPLLRRGITFIVPLTMFMYFYGYSKGIDQLVEKPTIWLTLAEPSQSYKATLLRQMEKGILVKDAAGKAVFYRWESVKSLSTPIVSSVERNRICRWLSVACKLAP